MTTSMNKTLAVLKLPTSAPALVSVARTILAAMTNNPSFPDPSPPLDAVAGAVAELSVAEVATRTRTRGTVALRDVKRATLVALLMGLRAYVQGVVDAQEPEHAATLIESAGMRVRSRGLPNKPPFDVRPGVLPGSVRLAVRSAGDRAAYCWAWSADAGVTWHEAPCTLQARTALSGLPSVAMCAFRYRAVTKAGDGDWSEPVWAVVR